MQWLARVCYLFFFQAEDGIRDLVRSRGLGDVYKRQHYGLAGKIFGGNQFYAGSLPFFFFFDQIKNRIVHKSWWCWCCLLYTSDAADERSSVDLGGRRIIKKKKREDDGQVGTVRKNRHNIIRQ